jgi:hypothetical protein
VHLIQNYSKHSLLKKIWNHSPAHAGSFDLKKTHSFLHLLWAEIFLLQTRYTMWLCTHCKQNSPKFHNLRGLRSKSIGGWTAWHFLTSLKRSGLNILQTSRGLFMLFAYKFVMNLFTKILACVKALSLIYPFCSLLLFLWFSGYLHFHVLFPSLCLFFSVRQKMFSNVLDINREALSHWAV